MVDDPKTLSVPEAGEWLGLGRNSAYEAARRGDIPTIKIGRLIRVRQAVSDHAKPSAPRLAFHPLADVFPLTEGEAFEQLVEDIRDHGLREPIVLFEGKILDGRNRYQACIEAGVAIKTRAFDQAVEGSAEAFVISTNVHRRHLTSKDKREFIGKLLRANPSLSDRAIARMVGVDNKTV